MRDIQHFIYCPHRWGLINIDDIWAENAFVIKANLQHENVHSDKITYKKDCKILNAIKVYNDDYDIFGVVDVLELTKEAEGVPIGGERYNFSIVEHKPTKPKDSDFNYADALQVFAQKISVDYIFKTNCRCYIYYNDTKKRVLLPFDKEFKNYSDELKRILEEMREYLKQNLIPKIKRGQNCSGCSLKDLCIPKVKSNFNIKASIDEMVGEL